MSEPPSTNGGGPHAAAGGVVFSAPRPPRLPRWTRQEILVLIEGKRAVESRGKGRGLGRASSSSLVGSSGPVEPKWASVSTYCRRRGVDRGPVQCRKRWSNLAGDFKKIKEWEASRGGEKESFWAMRNDLRRERRLPGFFDREVFDILDGTAGVERAEEEDEAEDETVFDSGRTAAEDGLFSDCDGEDEEKAAAAAAEVEELAPAAAVVALPTPAAEVVTPISEKKFEAPQQECSDSGVQKGKRPAETHDKGPSSSSQEEGQAQKRRRASREAHADNGGLQNQLIEVLERNTRMLTSQLEAQNVNNQLDREQRKDQTDGLLLVLNKVADALGRIADKL